MVLIFIAILDLLQIVRGSNLVHYKFNTNFGQIFYDYSGYGNHGQNGISIDPEGTDTIPTSRGAYFKDQTVIIRLPNNQIQPKSLSLGINFSLVMWLNHLYGASDFTHMTIRIKPDWTSWFALNRMRDQNCHFLRINFPNYLNQYLYSAMDSFSLGKIYLGKWTLLAAINEGAAFRYIANGVQVFTYNQPHDYYEDGLYEHYIGWKGWSFIGFFWNYLVFDEIVDISNFYSSTYSGMNCLQSPCPSTCSPAIKESSNSYCITLDTSISCIGCSYSCKDSICLDCSSCATKSCALSGGNIICICPDTSITNFCICNSGYFLWNDYYKCEKCYGECLTCNSNYNCTTCKYNNSLPHSSIGCVCKVGYYNITALINSGICLECYPECSSCTEEFKCLNCKDPNSIPDINKGCKCKEFYFNSSSLLTNGTCEKCHNECFSCSNNLACDACISNHAIPNEITGCMCKDGYYNKTALISASNCLECYMDCKTCEVEKKCLSCKDPNADMHTTLGCVCRPGYYNTSLLNTNSSCMPCFSECKTCSSKYNCITCFDSNSSVQISGGCLCNQPFYNVSQIDSEGDCLPCNIECKNCSNSSKCIACLDIHSKPSSIQGCDCIEGYYKESVGKCKPCHIDCNNCTTFNSCNKCNDLHALLNNSECFCIAGWYNSSVNQTLICSQCTGNCSECKNLDYCLTCAFKSMNLIDGKCECPENSVLANDSCIAAPGYYMEFDMIHGFVCNKCDQSCLTCFGQGRHNCEKCANKVLKKAENCDSCEDGMYFRSYYCYNCSDNCSSCLNESYCLKCKDTDFYAKDGDCIKDCGDFMYFNGQVCENCSSLCKLCTPKCKKCLPECTECVKNSTLNYKNLCECDKGYMPSKTSCLPKYFHGSLSIHSISLANITFSEPLVKDLKEEDFEFTVSNRTDLKSFLLTHTLKLEYSFSLKFDTEVKEGTQIQFAIKQENLFSLNNSQLKDYILNSSLPSYIPVLINPTIQVILSSTQAMAQAGVSSSVGASLMSNPAAAWSLINSIQLLIFLPLANNPLTPTLKTFLSGFFGYNLMPNYFAGLFDPNACSEPYLEAKEYGIESSVFFINTGKPFFIFFVALIVWPIVYSFSKCKQTKIAAKAIKILGNYKYSFFLRFWTQSFLEIFVYSVIQMKSKVVYPVQGHINLLFASFMAFCSVLTPPLVFIFSINSGQKINKSSDDFKTKWGSLFLEFKNDKGYLSSQYYLIYFTRRVVYALSQIFLNSLPYVQGGLNILFSVVTLAHLIYYRPFKDSAILITNIIGESNMCLVMILAFTYLWDFSELNKDNIEKTIIFSVLSSILLQIIVSIYNFYHSLKILWQKIEKIRAVEFAKRFGDIINKEFQSN